MSSVHLRLYFNNLCELWRTMIFFLFWYIKPQNWKMVYFSTVALLHNFETILSPVLSPNCTTWAIPLKESFWILSIPVTSNKKIWAFSALPPPSPRSVFWHCHQISRIRIAFIWIILYTQTRNVTHPWRHPLVTNHPWYFSPSIPPWLYSLHFSCTPVIALDCLPLVLLFLANQPFFPLTLLHSWSVYVSTSPGSLPSQWKLLLVHICLLTPFLM